MGNEEVQRILNASGVSMSGSDFSFANVMAWIIFGAIGFVAATYGWKQKNYRVLIIGAAISIYPYFIHNVWLMYLIGIALTAALYFWRE